MMKGSRLAVGKTLYTTFVLLVLSLLIAPFPVSAGTRRVVMPEEANQMPYNLSLLLRMDFGRHQAASYCSAAIVRPNYVLTASHCLAGETGQLFPIQSIVATRPGSRQQSVAKKTLLNKQPYMKNPLYAGYDDLKNDIALVKLSSVSRDLKVVNTQSVNMKFVSDPHQLVGRQVTTVSQSHNVAGTFVTSTGPVLEVLPSGTIKTDLPTVQGQSGSPVFLDDGSLIGVLVAMTDECVDNGLCGQSEVALLTPEINQALFAPQGLALQPWVAN